MNLTTAIKIYLAKRGKSQNWLADQIGVTKSGLSHYMAGNRPWKLSEMIAIANVFGIKLSTLIQAAEDESQ